MPFGFGKENPELGFRGFLSFSCFEAMLFENAEDGLNEEKIDFVLSGFLEGLAKLPGLDINFVVVSLCFPKGDGELPLVKLGNGLAGFFFGFGFCPKFISGGFGLNSFGASFPGSSGVSGVGCVDFPEELELVVSR